MPRVFLGLSALCRVGVNERQQNPGAQLGNWYRTQNLMQNFHYLLKEVMYIFQVSEQQLKEAVAQAVENVKFGKERHQWSLEGKETVNLHLQHLCLLRKL